MNPTKVFLFFILLFLLSYSHAAPDQPWSIGSQAVHKNGPKTSVVGKRWTLGSRSNDIYFFIHLDAQNDRARGNWYGEIRSYEKFYVKVYVVNRRGEKQYIKLKDVAARGPDAIGGRWKDGPATSRRQSMVFDLSIGDIKALGQFKSIIVNYSSAKAKNKSRDITFPLNTYNQNFAKLSSLVQSEGAGLFLLTQDKIDNTPMNQLPSSYAKLWQSSLSQVSQRLSKPVSELKKLSINQIKKLIADTQKSNKRKQHQAIYDQEPNWLDLNVCPKPDVRACRNMGKEAYTNDILVGGNFSYGKILGVVWRSKNSITHIYGGSVDIGIEPEIKRASSPGHYYIVKKNGVIGIRSIKNMLIR